VLIKELQALGLAVEVLSENETPMELSEEAGDDLSVLDGINLSGMERGEF
jgi:DNA-directed RNA polymerase subunit beta